MKKSRKEKDKKAREVLLGKGISELSVEDRSWPLRVLCQVGRSLTRSSIIDAVPRPARIVKRAIVQLMGEGVTEEIPVRLNSQVSGTKYYPGVRINPGLYAELSKNQQETEAQLMVDSDEEAINDQS